MCLWVSAARASWSSGTDGFNNTKLMKFHEFQLQGLPIAGELTMFNNKKLLKFRSWCVCEFWLQGLPTAGELTALKRTTKNKLEVSGVKGSGSVGVPDNKCEFSVLSPVLCSFGYRNHTVLKMRVRLQWGKREEWVSNVCAGVRQLSQSGVMTTMFFFWGGVIRFSFVLECCFWITTVVGLACTFF